VAYSGAARCTERWAFVLAYLLLVWGALLGCWMLSRTLGLRHWQAHFPGVTLVTGAWYLGEAFGRAGFGSFAAMSSMPLFLAGLVGVSRREPTRTSDAAALVVGSVLVFGAHNLSMLWGTVFLVATAVAVAVFVRGARLPPLRRLFSIALLVGLGVGVNAWFLVPNLVYSSRTHIAHVAAMDKAANDAFARPEIVFHPLRAIPREHVDFWRWQAGIHGYAFEGPTSQYTQFPLLPFGWATIVVLACRCRPEARAVRQLFLAATAVVGCFMALVLEPSLFDVLPSSFRMTQFAFRMHSYILFGATGAVGAGVVALRYLHPGPRRAAIRALAVVGALSVLLTVWQGWTATSVIGALGYDVPRSRILASSHAAPFWYPYNDFWDADARVVDNATVTVPLGSFDDLHDGRLRTRIVLPVADAVALNLGTGPYLVRVKGVRVLGRTADGLVAVQGARPGEPADRDVVVERAHTWPFTVGPAVTLVSITALVASVAVRGATDRWSRPRRRIRARAAA
jgi:hypothetical protein